jgi:pyrroloquinoline quinone (PQQ) biosynthesis protein C
MAAKPREVAGIYMSESPMGAEVMTFVEAVRQDLQPLNARILGHPYLQALQAGRIKRERLRLFAAQQSYIIESDLRSVAQMVARAGSERSRGFFLELLEGERVALKVLESFTAAVGGPTATAGADEPLPGAFAYCAFVAWLSLYASEAEFAGAFLINLPVWGTNCGRMADALRNRYGLSEAEVSFFTLFSAAPTGFEERAATVVAEGLAQGVATIKIRRAAALLQGYELLFWDTMAQAAMLTT